MHKDRLSIVVPVYNSSASLDKLVSGLLDVLLKLKVLYEIILINDGSSDSSWEKIQDLSAKHDGVIGVDLDGNFGQDNALYCGLSKARGDYVVTMDDDLQHPPEEILKLYKNIISDKTLEVIVGLPLYRHSPLIKKAGSWFTHKFLFRGNRYCKNMRPGSFRIMRKCLVRR